MSFIARTCLLATLIRICMSTGYMSTIAPMWGDNKYTYAICVLVAGSLHVHCVANIDTDLGFAQYNQTMAPNDTTFWAIAGGGLGSCGLRYDLRSPVCWGDIEVPAEYQNVSYSDLSCGAAHACAVRDDGSGQVDFWGSPKYEHGSEIVPPKGMFMKSITVGDWFSCGLNSSDKAVCWGTNLTDMSNVTVKDPKASFERIYAGRGHVCGVEKGTKRTLCWGNNDGGQSSPPLGYNFSAITAGGFTCGLRDDNYEVVCWGDNQFGERNAPQGQKFSVIASGDWYTCGVRMDQRLQILCWGSFSGTLANVKVNQALCVKNCSNNQIQQLDIQVGMQQCIHKTDKVCVPKIPLNNSLLTRNSSLTTFHHATSAKRIVILASVLGSAGLLIISLVGCTYFFASRKSRKIWRNLPNRVIEFTSAELRSATQNYSETMILGKGAFGVVYKGILANGDQVAIKKATSIDISRSFDQELHLLSRVHHTCLVKLVGYCKQEKLLVYEFMKNGSLYDCLFKKEDVRIDWIMRMKIASEAAHGLEYLHTYASPNIIHRDVKSSNILLDKHWQAHVSDFGLSLLGPPSNTSTASPLSTSTLLGPSHLSNMTVVGTRGYIDPEYYQTSQLTSKSDVYSFGVVLLELLAGRRAIMGKEESIAGLVAWVSARAEQHSQVLDSSLSLPEDPSPLHDALELALQCVKVRGKDRPSMLLVASSLDALHKRLVASTNIISTEPISRTHAASSASTTAFNSDSTTSSSSASMTTYITSLVPR